MSDSELSPLTIVVLVKYVPDTQFDRHLSGENGSLDRAESILSELDEYPLEAALQLSEARGGEAVGNRVIALTMGSESAVGAVKKALQIGAYEGIQLSDPALAGSDLAATSLALAAAIKTLGPVDLILTGMSSTDGETTVLPAQLAGRLGLPQLTLVSSIEIEGREVTVQRDGDSYTELIQSALPALVSVTDQINQPRYPNFKGIMAAKKRQISVLSLADIGLIASQVGRAGSWTEVQQAAPRPARSAGTVITDDGDAGLKLVDFLAEQNLL